VTDIVLRDIDPILADRIRRIGEARGWSAPETLLNLLEVGLYDVEHDGRARFDDRESTALESAIAAMEQVPNDPGFALIGRAPAPRPAAAEPDQSLLDRFELS